MELIQKTIRYNQEGKKTFDQFYLDEDYNVPDAKQDVRRIIKGQGTVKIEDVKLVENYVRISGKLYFQILYVTDQGEPMPAVLDGKIPFEEMVYTEGEERTQYFVRNIRVEFGTTLVHSRKISIRAMIEMEVGCENLIEEETAVDLESSASIYKKQKPVNLLKLHTAKKDTYRIKEEITIGQHRMNCFCGENCRFSVCISQKKERPTGWSRVFLMRDESNAAGRQKGCIMMCSTRWKIHWQMYGWMRTERCASSGLREP